MKAEFFKRLIDVINIFIAITCTGLLAYQTKVCLEKYLQSETRTVLKIKPTGDATFLAFTICPAYESAYKDDILNNFGSSKVNIRNGNFSLAAADWKADEVYEKVTHDFDEVVTKFKIETVDKNLPKIVIRSRKDSVKAAKIVTSYGLTLGRCYSIQLSPEITYCTWCYSSYIL